MASGWYLAHKKWQLYVLCGITYKKTLWVRSNCYPQFKDAEMEAQREEWQVPDGMVSRCGLGFEPVQHGSSPGFRYPHCPPVTVVPKRVVKLFWVRVQLRTRAVLLPNAPHLVDLLGFGKTKFHRAFTFFENNNNTLSERVLHIFFFSFQLFWAICGMRKFLETSHLNWVPAPLSSPVSSVEIVFSPGKLGWEHLNLRECRKGKWWCQGSLWPQKSSEPFTVLCVTTSNRVLCWDKCPFGRK